MKLIVMMVSLVASVQFWELGAIILELQLSVVNDFLSEVCSRINRVRWVGITDRLNVGKDFSCKDVFEDALVVVGVDCVIGIDAEVCGRWRWCWCWEHDLKTVVFTSVIELKLLWINQVYHWRYMEIAQTLQQFTVIVKTEIIYKKIF